MEKQLGRKGLVQVYTGNGKGKTTAALGLALRAAGHGQRVCVLQFLKGNAKCGEHLFAERTGAFEIVQPNTSSCFKQGTEALQAAAREALSRARELLRGSQYDVVVLDEILAACKRGLVSPEEVLELIRTRPSEMELILTGRGAPREIIEAADLVTEMTSVKHPYEKGIRARRGIEY